MARRTQTIRRRRVIDANTGNRTTKRSCATHTSCNPTERHLLPSWSKQGNLTQVKRVSNKIRKRATLRRTIASSQQHHFPGKVTRLLSSNLALIFDLIISSYSSIFMPRTAPVPKNATCIQGSAWIGQWTMIHQVSVRHRKCITRNAATIHRPRRITHSARVDAINNVDMPDRNATVIMTRTSHQRKLPNSI